MLEEHIKKLGAKILDIVRNLKVAMIFQKSSKETYVVKFLARKLFIACWLFGRLQLSAGAETSKLYAFLELFPDANEYMEGIPKEWSVFEVSWFLHKRPDRFMFSSMWPCLFGEAVDLIDSFCYCGLSYSH